MGGITPFAAKGFLGQTRSTLKFLSRVNGARTVGMGIGLAGLAIGIAGTLLVSHLFDKKEKEFDNTGLVVEHTEENVEATEQTNPVPDKVEEQVESGVPEYHIARRGDSAYSIAEEYYQEEQVPEIIKPLMERNNWGINEDGMTTNLHPQDTVYLVQNPFRVQANDIDETKNEDTDESKKEDDIETEEV